MPRSETVLTLFVASPSDVAEERQRLEEIVRELNITWSKEIGVRLELVRWETHVLPGIGIDPQDVINQQVDTDYDIFIGIMWCRYGTPTGRAGSGTVEEFSKAVEKFDGGDQNIRVMFYFKDAPINPSAIDAEQLRQVHAFKKEMGQKNLYFSFGDIDNFEQLLRIHLSRQITSFKQNKPLQKKPNEVGSDSAAISDGSLAAVENLSDASDEDIGILDCMENFEDKIKIAGNVIARIHEAMQELGFHVDEVSSEVNSTSDSVPYATHVRNVLSRFSERLGEYAFTINSEIPIYKESFESAISSATKAVTLLSDFGSNVEKESDFHSSVDQLVTVHDAVSDSIRLFINNVSKLPRMTKEFNQKKREAIKSTENILLQLKLGRELLVQLLDTMEGSVNIGLPPA